MIRVSTALWRCLSVPPASAEAGGTVSHVAMCVRCAEEPVYILEVLDVTIMRIDDVTVDVSSGDGVVDQHTRAG